MSKGARTVKMARPGEPEAVRTTIVGGRPPGNGAIPRHIPRGVEVLIKKAAVDPAFKEILFEKRAAAAEAIGLKLTAAEEAMLAAVPRNQLEGIIAHTRISPKLKPAFLGYAAGAMLAALGAGALDYALDRYDAHRERDLREVSLRTLKTYAVRLKSAPKPARGLRDIVTTLTGGERADRKTEKDLDYLDRRITSLGVRADRPIREMGGGLSRYDTGKADVRLFDSPPASVAGIGASHPNRSPDVIGSVFRRHLFGVMRAYISAREKNPSLGAGEIVVRISISPDGRVESAHIVSDSLGDGYLRANLLSRVRSWRFPPAEEGNVTVVYPFVFAPARDYSEE